VQLKQPVVLVFQKDGLLTIGLELELVDFAKLMVVGLLQDIFGCLVLGISLRY
jgi:hypothetical protein